MTKLDKALDAIAAKLDADIAAAKDDKVLIARLVARADRAMWAACQA